jgi:hypothetical protein
MARAATICRGSMPAAEAMTRPRMTLTVPATAPLVKVMPNQQNPGDTDETGGDEEPATEVLANDDRGDGGSGDELEVQHIDPVAARTRARPATSSTGPNAPPKTMAMARHPA